MRHPDVASRVAPLIEAGLVATTAALDAEVISSARNPAEYEQLWADHRVAYKCLPTEDEHCQAALAAQRKLARQGLGGAACAPWVDAVRVSMSMGNQPLNVDADNILRMTHDVSAVNMRAPLLESDVDEVEHPVGNQLLSGGISVAEWAVEKQCREPMHGGPGGFVNAVAAIRREHTGGDKVIDGAHQDPEGMMIGDGVIGGSGMPRVNVAASLGVRESRSEQTRFSKRKVDVPLSGRPEAGDRAFVRRPAVGYRTQPGEHRVG